MGPLARDVGFHGIWVALTLHSREGLMLLHTWGKQASHPQLQVHGKNGEFGTGEL